MAITFEPAKSVSIEDGVDIPNLAMGSGLQLADVAALFDAVHICLTIADKLPDWSPRRNWDPVDPHRISLYEILGPTQSDALRRNVVMPRATTSFDIAAGRQYWMNPNLPNSFILSRFSKSSPTWIELLNSPTLIMSAVAVLSTALKKTTRYFVHEIKMDAMDREEKRMMLDEQKQKYARLREQEEIAALERLLQIEPFAIDKIELSNPDHNDLRGKN